MSLPIKSELPLNFLNREVRCGYEVSEKLKKIWAVELDLLEEFNRVCEKYGIKYSIFGGTLLGAVRHGGFVPWDDDLDVALPREEFKKLCAVAQKEFCEPYFFQDALSDSRFFLPYARLRNSKTTGAIKGSDSPEYNNGIYIDIYVLEGYVDSRLFWLIQNGIIKFLVKCLTLYHQSKPRNNTVKEHLGRLLRPFARMFKYKTLVWLYRVVLGMFTANSRRIGLRHELSEQAKRYWLYREDIANVQRIPFEHLLVPAPKNREEILKHIYGDYLRFPSVAERGAWHEGKIYFDPDIPYQEYFKRLRGNSTS